MILRNLLTTDRRLNFVLLATYWAYSSLLILLVYSYLSNDSHSWKLLTFQLLPLLLVASGLIKKHYRAHSCLCFIILAYFTAYLVEAGSPLAEINDWIGLILTVIIFCSAMMASRGLQRLIITEQPETPKPEQLPPSIK